MARKAWADLSENQRKRYIRAGVTPEQHAAGVNLSAARGHARTPERPERATRNPDKYAGYLERRSDLVERVKSLKARIWGDRLQYKRGQESRKAVDVNPITNGPLDRKLAYRFLKMSTDEAERMVSRVARAIAADQHDMDDWAFLFYH